MGKPGTVQTGAGWTGSEWANQGQFKQEQGGQVASDTARVKFKSVVPANLSDQVSTDPGQNQYNL